LLALFKRLSSFPAGLPRDGGLRAFLKFGIWK
jgi:hypothetical protein